MNPRLPIDVDRLMSSADFGMAGIRAGLDQKKELHREAKLRCSYCGKEDDEKKPLKACTQCREARYCDRECQVAHYKYQHKKDCTSFREPPLCRLWNTKTVLPDTKYPERPTFAHGHNDGVGCWVSVAGSIDCSLSPTPGDRLTERKKMSTAEMLAHLPGAPSSGSYLDLSILVQNRRKAEPVIVVGKAFLAVTTKQGKSKVMEGKKSSDIVQMIPHPEEGEVPAITPAFIKLTSFNGKDEKTGKKPSAAIQDQTFSAVLLRPGDFAIFESQYRLGGPSITKDFEALSLLSHIIIPAVPYDPSFPGPYKDLLPRAADKGELCEVRGMIDQEEVQEWYADYVMLGKKAYITSHYGQARAEMIDAGDNMGQHLQQMMLAMAAGRMGSNGGSFPGFG